MLTRLALFNIKYATIFLLFSLQKDSVKEENDLSGFANRAYDVLEAPEDALETKEIIEATYDIVQDNQQAASQPPVKQIEVQPDEGTTTPAPPPPPPLPPLLESTSMVVYASVDKSKKKSKTLTQESDTAKAPNVEMALYSNVQNESADNYDKLDVQPISLQVVAEPEYDIVKL